MVFMRKKTVASIYKIVYAFRTRPVKSIIHLQTSFPSTLPSHLEFDKKNTYLPPSNPCKSTRGPV